MTDDRLTELYRRYGTVIFVRCRALLHDDAAAEDATQETFLRVHRHLDRVPDAREALYWIYRVATNYCLNELRDRRRRPTPDDTVEERSPSAAADFEDRIAQRELAEKLIAAATPKVRPVAWLYHVDGFDQEEVARILDLSRRTIATRLATFGESARRFLRRTAAA
jgi:RNA polymerase sigma-70 factor (ECF subfamily)